MLTYFYFSYRDIYDVYYFILFNEKNIQPDPGFLIWFVTFLVKMVILKIIYQLTFLILYSTCQLSIIFNIFTYLYLFIQTKLNLLINIELFFR